MSSRSISSLVDIPNVGPRISVYLNRIGIEKPVQLIGKDPYKLYEKVNKAYGRRIDPCLCDVFISAVRFMEGESPRPWWFYTKERKATLKA